MSLTKAQVELYKQALVRAQRDLDRGEATDFRTKQAIQSFVDNTKSVPRKTAQKYQQTMHITDNTDDSLPTLHYDPELRTPPRDVSGVSDDEDSQPSLKKARVNVNSLAGSSSPKFEKSISSSLHFGSSSSVASIKRSNQSSSQSRSSSPPSSPPFRSSSSFRKASEPSSKACATPSESRPKLPLYTGNYGNVQVPMISKAYKFKTGKYTRMNVDDALRVMFQKDHDYLYYLHSSGVITKGHKNCDPEVAEAIGNFEVRNPDLVLPSGRLLPPENFWVCFGRGKGSFLSNAPSKWVHDQHVVNQKSCIRPWFEEAWNFAPPPQAT
ncbi:hypothetical protein P153DRAFT_399411 [Dothidotthia symphoricarpi CBS 119687]|uniref:Uncharacterized protein n=1 Tax=Dothidotthia symphoricarpi CBS 119687 TaxID=1392245 RepID=A0A6A6A3Q8_9PLEO|nr:uncharacterized protein P153DRAFT_399411 [Dothidotthia symphoricarpi CBS 119687]KAF2126652.1 hypothetical protein P153DRAFT_399411 [Dothidotthia symphoricarpi CBS 119687]